MCISTLQNPLPICHPHQWVPMAGHACVWAMGPPRARLSEQKCAVQGKQCSCLCTAHHGRGTHVVSLGEGSNFGGQYATELQWSSAGDMRIVLSSLGVAHEEIIWPRAASQHKYRFWSNLEDSQSHTSMCQSRRSVAPQSTRWTLQHTGD